jgi:uncharacterized protein
VEVYLPIAEMPIGVFFMLGVSGAVGFLSGLFGVGGGFLLTPILIFAGIPGPVAVATIAAQIAASSTTGAIAYWRRQAVDFRLGGLLTASGIAGSALGVWAFNALRRLGQFEAVLQLSYVGLLGAVGGLMLVESLRALLRARRGTARPRRRAGAHGWYERLPLRVRFPRSGICVSALPLVALGLFVGFAGTILGVGGGFVVVPALIYLFRVPTQVVVGTSLFQVLFTMVAAVLLHAVSSGTVDIALALLLIVGGVIGAQFGASAGRNLKGEQFRLLLALLVFGVAVRFAVELAVTPAEPFSVVTSEARE